jgi:hypothetical protein
MNNDLCNKFSIETFQGENLQNISFQNYCKYERNYAFSPKYQVAFIKDCLIKNNRGAYLSRLFKKNGKHRYYLTSECETFYCGSCGKKGCCSGYCRGKLDYYYHFDSKYVGKDINEAIKELFDNENLI